VKIVLKSKDNNYEVRLKDFHPQIGYLEHVYRFKDGKLELIDPNSYLLEEIKKHPEYGKAFWREGDGPEDHFKSEELRNILVYLRKKEDSVYNKIFEKLVLRYDRALCELMLKEEDIARLEDASAGFISELMLKEEDIARLEELVDSQEETLKAWEAWFSEGKELIEPEDYWTLASPEEEDDEPDADVEEG
jgi:hypothetical protein